MSPDESTVYCELTAGQVYTRNRAFRLLGSRKWGPGKPSLWPASSNKFKLGPAKSAGALQASLVVPVVSSGHTILDVPSRFRVAGTGLSPVPGLSFAASRHSSGGGTLAATVTTSGGVTWGAPAWSSSAGGGAGGGADVTAKGPAVCRSPVGPLDDWMGRLIPWRSGGQPGRVKSWAVDFYSSEAPREDGGEGRVGGPGRVMVSYQVKDNRWCERIGRAHKSNNITLVAELMVRRHGGAEAGAGAGTGTDGTEGAMGTGAGAGTTDTCDTGGTGAGAGAGAGAGGTGSESPAPLVVTGRWHQRCWDPDCARYQSPARPLPQTLLDSLSKCF